MSYFDAYLIPIRPESLQDYRGFADAISSIYLEYGALGVTEILLDPDVGDGTEFHAEGARAALERSKLRDFREAAAATGNETVILAWTEWPGKSVRERALPQILADPRVQPRDGQEPLFDGTRLVAGGFRALGRAVRGGPDA